MWLPFRQFMNGNYLIIFCMFTNPVIIRYRNHFWLLLLFLQGLRPLFRPPRGASPPPWQPLKELWWKKLRKCPYKFPGKSPKTLFWHTKIIKIPSESDYLGREIFGVQRIPRKSRGFPRSRGDSLGFPGSPKDSEEVPRIPKVPGSPRDSQEV